jgi:chromosome segregation ATPase
MQALQQLFYSDLPIPVWQIVFYVGVISYFMIQRWFKLSFVTSFILVLYWLHYAFRADLVSVTNEDHLARAIYYVLAFALVLLCIFALSFLEVDADSLLEKREKEIALIKAQLKAAENTAASLRAETETNNPQGSQANKKREKKLNTRIEKLQHKLEDADNLLEARAAEISDLHAKVSEAEKSASAFESLLEIYQTQESNTKKQLEDDFKAQLEALRNELKESERLRERRDAELHELQAEASEAAQHANALKAQLEQPNDSRRDRQLESRLNARIEQLENELKQGEMLLENRNSEISALRAKASEAEKHAVTLKTQLEETAEAPIDPRVERELHAKVATLENELKENERHLQERNAEVGELKAKALEADTRATSLKAQLERDQSQGSAAKKKLEEKLNGKIARLENQLKQGEILLEKRNTEIAELQSRASEAERNASVLKTQLQKDRNEASDAKTQLEKEFSKHVADLENRLKEKEGLLEKSNAEMLELQAKATEAEKNALALKTQLESSHTDNTATTRKIEEQLRAQIRRLEDDLNKGDLLLENRNLEISALRTKVAEAERAASALKAQWENDTAQAYAGKKELEDQLNAKIIKLENDLKEGEALLESRNSEVASLKGTVSDAEAAKTALETDKANVVAASKKREEQLHTRIMKLEDQLKEGESLLAKSNAEIRDLQAKASEAEKQAAVARSQADKIHGATASKKPGTEVNARIAKLENQLKENESLLQTRNAEIAELKAHRPSATETKPPAVKPHTTISRKWEQHRGSDDPSTLEEDVRRKLHQFQYAVKYLEDEIKEKDRLLSLMAKKSSQGQASTKSAVDEDFKKKIHQLEQAVKYLEVQGKEKDGLLSLMAKRNKELADLKSQAEARLEALETNPGGDQTANQPELDSER